jgi:hypothetical protein
MCIEFVKDDTMSLETLRNRVARQTRPVAQLIAAGPRLAGALQ